MIIKKYKASFSGRTINAIGVSYSIDTTVMGKNKENAKLNLYNDYENISSLTLKEIILIKGNHVVIKNEVTTMNQYASDMLSLLGTKQVIERVFKNKMGEILYMLKGDKFDRVYTINSFE